MKNTNEINQQHLSMLVNRQMNKEVKNKINYFKDYLRTKLMMKLTSKEEQYLDQIDTFWELKEFTNHLKETLDNNVFKLKKQRNELLKNSG